MHNIFLSGEGTESTEENGYVLFSYTSGIVDMTIEIRLSLDGHFQVVIETDRVRDVPAVETPVLGHRPVAFAAQGRAGVSRGEDFREAITA